MALYPPAPMPGSMGEAPARIPLSPLSEERAESIGKAALEMLSQQRFFADVSFAVFLCLSGPTTLMSVGLGLDVDVAFFIGRVGLLGLLIPVFVLSMHMLHLHQIHKGRPRLYIFFAFAVVTSLSGILIGRIHHQRGRDLFAHLKSGDCTGSRGRTEKIDLQDAWMQAYHVWQKCHRRLVQENGGVEFPNQILLQHCREWTSMIEGAMPPTGRRLRNSTVTLDTVELTRKKLQLQQFSYLASAEAAHACTGFCTGGGPFLWTQQLLEGRNGNVAGCSHAVAVHFRTVEVKGKLLIWYNLVVLLFVAMLFVTAKPTFQRWGYK